MMSDVLMVAKHVFAAQPNYVVLEPAGDAPHSDYWKTPVVAWAVVRPGYLEPITLELSQPSENGNSYAVLCPKGEVVMGDTTYPDARVWLEDVNRLAAERAARKA